MPLRGPNGEATTTCSFCNGHFKTCSVCKRLHTLQDDVCLTRDCTGVLIEAQQSYPSGRGALDGTRSASWNSGYTVNPFQVLETAALYAMAYRYGTLVGITSGFLMTFQWSGNNWTVRQKAQLPAPADFQVRSLLLDKGCASVLTGQKAYLFSLLGSIGSPTEIAGSYTHQVSCGEHLVLADGQGQLYTTYLAGGSVSALSLPAGAGALTDMASNGRVVVMCTDRGAVLRLDPVTGDLLQMTSVTGIRFTRLAVRENQVALLGDQNPTLRLMMLSLQNGSVLTETPLDGGSLPDFAWVANRIYVAKQSDTQSRLNCYDTQQLTQTPTGVTLAAGMETLGGMIALSGPHGIRLLLRRGNHGAQKFVLVDPVTGTAPSIDPMVSRNGFTSVDGWPADSPLVCVTENRLVIASRERNSPGKSWLRSYPLT